MQEPITPEPITPEPITQQPIAQLEIDDVPFRGIVEQSDFRLLAL